MKKLTSILFASIAITACIESADTSHETGELPPPGGQYGPCLDEAPRCWGQGECTEGPVGVTMCSAGADICPPAVIYDLTIFAKSGADFGGRCIVHCAADIDCYPDVGFVCGDGFCGWEGDE